jgi:hypothetical protein
VAYRLPRPLSPPGRIRWTSGTARRRSWFARRKSTAGIEAGSGPRIYAVPVGESGVLTEASLRVTPPANGQAKGIRWAADHELPT